MQATNWEFQNRAIIFGLIFGCAFVCYFLDSHNFTATLADHFAGRLQMDENSLARLLFALAACLLIVAALTRTLASSYLQASVVYAADVKTETLVADGPYRHTRNPLYFANICLALGLGAMMSRLGFLVAVAGMFVFCYRLIYREEADLAASQGEQYKRYQAAVPRLWPSLGPRVPSAGRKAKLADGFKAEFWCWGCAVSVAAFAITLNNAVFFGMLGASIAVFWVSSWLLGKAR
jgi:protein-S-isoprenylcysteine O-methyltransferase Ste14